MTKIATASKYKIRGISLLEVMLSIIVITAIVVASLRYYTTARDNTRIAQAVEMISNVANASFRWVEGKSQPGFAGISIAALVDSGLLPKIYNPTSPLPPPNPWRGSLAVGDDVNNSVTVRLGNVPVNACFNLQQKITNIGGTPGKCGTTAGDFTATWSQQD